MTLEPVPGQIPDAAGLARYEGLLIIPESIPIRF